MTEPAVVLSGLSARYGAMPVLDGIGLELHLGETVALLGRNGAGKTTLVSALFNLGPQLGGPAVAGGVRILGQDVAGWPTHRIARLGIALVPQGRGSFPGLSVTESLRLATVQNRTGAWTLPRIWDSFPLLARRRTASCSALSGGERQLLAIGRALLTQPRLLVMDEPSEGLAPLVAEAVIGDTIGRLAAEGLTLLLAEQNLALALRLCSRAVVLDRGGVVFDGSSAALLAAPDLLRGHLGV